MKIALIAEHLGPVGRPGADAYPGGQAAVGVLSLAQALAARIRQLLASPLLSEGLGIAAASRAQARYSWDRVSQETLAVYESLPRRPLQAAA